jgi:hypothetical protein
MQDAGQRLVDRGDGAGGWHAWITHDDYEAAVSIIEVVK